MLFENSVQEDAITARYKDRKRHSLIALNFRKEQHCNIVPIDYLPVNRLK